MVDAACGDRVLGVFAIEQDRHVQPWVIVKGEILIRSNEAMQIDVEELVPRYDPPSEHVRSGSAADDEVSGAAVSYPFQKFE